MGMVIGVSMSQDMPTTSVGMAPNTPPNSPIPNVVSVPFVSPW